MNVHVNVKRGGLILRGIVVPSSPSFLSGIYLFSILIKYFCDLIFADAVSAGDISGYMELFKGQPQPSQQLTIEYCPTKEVMYPIAKCLEKRRLSAASTPDSSLDTRLHHRLWMLCHVRYLFT